MGYGARMAHSGGDDRAAVERDASGAGAAARNSDEDGRALVRVSMSATAAARARDQGDRAHGHVDAASGPLAASSCHRKRVIARWCL